MDLTIESIIVNSFFLKHKRERAIYELSFIKKRREYIWKLNEQYFENKYLQGIDKHGLSSYKDILNLLKMNTPKECYIISPHSEFDGSVISCDLALKETFGNGPAIISFIHGKLAYFECELEINAPERYLLIRD